MKDANKQIPPTHTSEAPYYCVWHCPSDHDKGEMKYTMDHPFIEGYAELSGSGSVQDGLSLARLNESY